MVDGASWQRPLAFSVMDTDMKHCCWCGDVGLCICRYGRCAHLLMYSKYTYLSVCG